MMRLSNLPRGDPQGSLIILDASDDSVQHMMLTRDDQIRNHNECGEEGYIDAEADMLFAEARSAICVQRFDDSRNSAIHTTYRISLRSSSLREPRYPLLRVVLVRRVDWPGQLHINLQIRKLGVVERKGTDRT